MKITREETLPTEVILNIELEPDDLEPYLDRAYRRVVNKIRVPGFRQGKAPRAIVESLVGREHLLHEALNFLVPESVDQAVKQESIEPYMQPAVDVTELDPLSIKATVPLEPQVDLGNYQDLRIQPEPVNVTGEQVDEVVEHLRRDSAPWAPVDRPVQFDDLLTIDVEGTIDGRSVASDKGVEYVPSLESKSPLPGFSVHLEGAKEGETRSFSLKVPEDYSDVSMAGKECHFQVQVHGIKQKALPELDDEFAKGVGEGYESLEALKSSVLENLTRAAEREATQKLYAEALQQIVEGAGVDLPNLMVEREVDRLLREQAQSLQARRMTMDAYLQQLDKSAEELREELRPTTRERLVRSLVIRKLARDQGVEVTEEEVDREIEDMIANSDVKDQSLRRAMSSQSIRSSVESSILARKTLEQLAEIVQQERSAPEASAKAEEDSESDQGGTESGN